MDKLYIEATKYSPEIIFDPSGGTLSIEGESWPENAVDIYMPLLNALQDYFGQGKRSLKVSIGLEMMSTSSRIMYRELINTIQSAHEFGHDVKIIWFIYPGDTDKQEEWEEMMEDCTLPYSILEREE